MNFILSNIELDSSIQCRAKIDSETVNDYAERMGEGDKFPPVDLYGTEEKAWIGDGWHRVMAAKQLGLVDIAATLHAGGRIEALKSALAANALQGQRRTNADKRRCVEIALREFPKMSSRAIGEMCVVAHSFVERQRTGELVPESSSPATRTGLDGKQHAAKKPRKNNQRPPKGAGKGDPKTAPVSVRERKPPVLGPPSFGLQYARMAILDLEQIKDDDLERKAAFDLVGGWLNEHE